MNRFKIALTLVMMLFSQTLFANKYSTINYIIVPHVNNKVPKITIHTEIIGDLSKNLTINLPYTNKKYTSY
jgi:hypothetical protein